MKNKRKKKLLLIVGLSAALLVAVIISCSDDNWSMNDWKLTGGKSRNPEPVNTELTTEAAKVWFDQNYLPVLSLRTGRTVETTKTTGADESERLIKPYWKGAKEENWGDWEAVLLPIRSQHPYIMYDEETKNHWTPGDENSDFIRNVAHVVVLKDLRTGHICSFMEIFVGSYEYLKKRRIDKNSYLHRDSVFDGSVHFYELDGTFINGWMYTDGKITGRISESNDNSNLKLRSMYCDLYCWYETAQHCYDDTAPNFDEEYGMGATVTRHCTTASYERCGTICEYRDDNGSGSDYGGGGGGGSGNSSTTPPPGPMNNPKEKLNVYVPKNTDKFARLNLPLTMEKQLPNHCVISVMEYINHAFGGNINEGDYVTYYCQTYRINPYYFSGVDFDKAGALVNNFFNTTTDYHSIKDAIDVGYMVMTTIPGQESAVRHEIVIVGYQEYGDYICMDPETGQMQTIRDLETDPRINHYICITGIKE